MRCVFCCFRPQTICLYWSPGVAPREGRWHVDLRLSATPFLSSPPSLQPQKGHHLKK